VSIKQSLNQRIRCWYKEKKKLKSFVEFVGLFEHSDNPYPAEDEKLQLVNQTGLSLKQINNW
jgi:hypothetical protein